MPYFHKIPEAKGAHMGMRPDMAMGLSEDLFRFLKSVGVRDQAEVMAAGFRTGTDLAETNGGSQDIFTS